MDVDSGHSPHRSHTVTHFSEDIPILKGYGATLSKSFQLTLPMFLEHGNFPALLSKSHKQKFMDPQLLRVVDHINKIGVGRSYSCEKMIIKPKHSGINLLIADVSDNLFVPIISPKSIPSWNKRKSDYFDHLFAFADTHFTDDALLLVILPNDDDLKKKLARKSKDYGFNLACTWWGKNPIPMASPISTAKETRSFYIKVFARKGSSFRTRPL